ncbi:MAG TPA: hypothetical protein VIU33_08445, partial [Nitrospiria bacterium]
MIRKFGFLALLMAFAVACDDNPDVVVNTPGGTGGSITTPSVSIAEIRLNPDGAQTLVIGGT